jgi:ribose/xylose/arabinose/galactoside ABC-type transport system permease subunit
VVRPDGGATRRRRIPDELVLLGFVVILCLVFAFTAQEFLTGTNMQNLARQSSVLAMMAAGQIFVIIGGGIDISVGAQVSLLSLVAAHLADSVGVPLAFAITIGCGAFIGIVNGALVTLARISPIIATVATWQVLAGLALWWSDGGPTFARAEGYRTIGNGNILSLATPTVIAIVVCIVAGVLLHRSRFGRYVYAVGGNAEAARLSGIGVRRTVFLSYVVCSIITALGAVVLSSRVGGGIPDLGSGLEITVIAAVFIGGVAWGGGAGRMIGVVLGVALIAIVGNGLNLINVPTAIQIMVTGALMALAVAVNALRGSRRKGVRQGA